MRTELGSTEFWERLAAEPARLAAEVALIHSGKLDEALEQHPPLRAWVSAQYEAARVEEERAKWELTKAEARALLAAKKDNDPDTGKNKTVPVLTAEVAVNVEVENATQALLSASEKRAALRAMTDALEDRKDMLIQISAKRRAEMKDYS